jgi:hypothetical protein
MKAPQLLLLCLALVQTGAISGTAAQFHIRGSQRVPFQGSIRRKNLG